jgi:uncharacterized membrane protein
MASRLFPWRLHAPMISNDAHSDPQHRARSFLLRRLFLIGVALKGLDGALEILAGATLWIMSAAAVNRLLLLLVREELAEDPKDFIANYIVHLGQHLSVSVKTFASLYLLGHGVVKIVLVLNLVRNRRWAYPGAIVVLSGFLGYQAWRLAHGLSGLLALFTAFDVIVVVLIWLEYRGGSLDPST